MTADVCHYCFCGLGAEQVPNVTETFGSTAFLASAVAASVAFRRHSRGFRSRRGLWHLPCRAWRSWAEELAIEAPKAS